MTHRLIIFSAALFLLAAMFATPTQAQIIWRMDYSAGAAPNAGWAAEPTGLTHTRTRIAGAGPQGQDVYELRQLPCLTCSSWGGQYNWGWRDVIEPHPPQGARRFYRWRMRFTPDSNFLAISGGDGLAANLQNKLLIIGQGCTTGRCRFILSYRGDSAARRVQYFRIQIDGGEDDAETTAFNRGEWLNVQIELDASSSLSSADGGYKIWINNDNYAQPNAQRSAIQFDSQNWGFAWFGGFNNDGLLAGGVHAWQNTDFQVASSFNAGWNTTGPAAPRPLPPTAASVQ